MQKKKRGDNGGKDVRGERVNEERQVESIAQTGEKIRRCFLDFLNPPEKEQRSEGLKTVFPALAA